MSDSKNNPLPPDDFGATTPNIKIPKGDVPDFKSEPSNDWEKTNYNYSPKDLAKNEWSKSPYDSPQTPPADFGKTQIPSGKDGNWGKTEVNINLPMNQPQRVEQPKYQESKAPVYQGTASNVNIPQNEQPTYQDPNTAKADVTVATKKGGVSGWLWATLGLLAMFLFSIAVLLGVYFIFLNKTGFEVNIAAVPARSDVLVNGSYWGTTNSDGSMRLQSLKAGETKNIEIRNPNAKCRVIEIKSDVAKNGVVLNETASCSAGTTPTVSTAPQQCLEIKKGDYAKAAKCAYDELDKLEKKGSWTVDELLYAMNLYIVNFDSGKAVIKPNDMTFVAKASGFFKKLPPTTVVEVGGHTDNVGQDAKNQPLSEARAKSVFDALIQFGVTPSMLQMKGYGSKKPKESNDTEDGKFRNRRIEYTAVSK